MEKQRKRAGRLKEGLRTSPVSTDEQLVNSDSRTIVERFIMHITPSSEFLIHAVRPRESL